MMGWALVDASEQPFIVTMIDMDDGTVRFHAETYGPVDLLRGEHKVRIFDKRTKKLVADFRCEIFENHSIPPKEKLTIVFPISMNFD